MRHEFDVFVSTTIIENGIDIPLANTIVIAAEPSQGRLLCLTWSDKVLA